MNKVEYLLHEISKHSLQVSIAAQNLQAMSDGSVSDKDNEDLIKGLTRSLDMLNAVVEESIVTLEYPINQDWQRRKDKKEFIRKTVNDIKLIKDGQK